MVSPLGRLAAGVIPVLSCGRTEAFPGATDIPANGEGSNPYLRPENEECIAPRRRRDEGGQKETVYRSPLYNTP